MGLKGLALSLGVAAAKRFFHGLEVLEANGGGWSGSPPIEMLDASGKRFACRVAEKNTTPTKREASTVGELLSSLEGVCARLNQGWWTYEWCHRRHVRQFHQDHAASAREPDWSLGDFARSEGADFPVGGLNSAVDVFDKGGQRCDETDRGRESRVSFECCDAAPRARRSSSSSKSSKTTKKKTKKGDAAYLTTVDETELCEYSLTVCAPSLCTGQPTRNATAAGLLGALQGVCLQRHEGWWSFEFCYRKTTRQFHVEIDEKDGRKTPRVVAEFSLGTFRDQRREATDDQLIVKGDDDRPRVELEYGNGTDCDLRGAKRATTIKLFCGDANVFSSVVEDRTCHYVFTIFTPALCKHAAFSVKPNARSLRCDALDDNDDIGV
ncbi:hypothetical protein CTAYLR_008173 [Chrysophaeum taylorii]|uniref:MRH domain-containing protein n=1 Tax=Chrysophaeum taylorii TaxID=2483200 RepID=A0AAD7XJL6_9STRA|nr:hypothetical protein CTAYLR_008173 [Chrysophaeum taylorii]